MAAVRTQKRVVDYVDFRNHTRIPRFDRINIAFHGTPDDLRSTTARTMTSPIRCMTSGWGPSPLRVRSPRIGVSSSSAFGSAVGCSRAVRAGPLVAVVGHLVPVTTVAPRCDMHCTASILHGRKQLLH